MIFHIGLLFGVSATLILLVWLAAYLSVRLRGQPLDMAFFGAVIGAAGTILAATIAYVAVQLQIDATKEQAAENARSMQKMERQGAEMALNGLRASRKDLQEILDLFAGTTAGTYRDRLLAIYKSGKLPINIIGLMPGNFPGRTHAFVQRMSTLAMQIVNMQLTIPDPTVRAANQDWIASDANVLDALNDGRKIVSDMDADISAREKAL